MTAEGLASAVEPIDETEGEVNVSCIPRNAIIGWMTVSDMRMDGDNDDNSRLETPKSRIFRDKKYNIQFNPEYKAEPPAAAGQGRGDPPRRSPFRSVRGGTPPRRATPPKPSRSHARGGGLPG